MATISTPDLDQLKRAVQIAEQIESLEAQLASILSGATTTQRTRSVGVSKGSGASPIGGGKRVMSPEARERIAAAQRRRWAKAKRQSVGSTVSSSKAGATAKKKGGITAEGRAKLAAVMKARWAARKKGAPPLNAKK